MSDGSQPGSSLDITLISSTLDRLYGVVETPHSWPGLTQSLADLLDILGDDAARAHPGEADREADVLISWLLPHLGRVLQQQEALFAQQDLIDFQGTLLDQHPLAIGLCSAAGTVLWANRSMRLCLDNMAPRALRELLSARHPATQRVHTEQGEATVLAMSAATLGLGYVVLLASTPFSIHLDAAMLKTLFGFTEAEARIAQRLAEGLAPEAIAEHHGTSVLTVRTQIKQVMGKTGSSRQSELVARLLTSPASLPMPELDAAASLPGKVLRLDGRNLGYVDQGPRDGIPVFFMHSWAGSRLQSPPDGKALYDHGVRLIVPERPGMGRSDLHPDGGLDSWSGDVAALADYLGIARFAVIGYSRGSIFAIATASSLKSRVTHLSLVAPLSPLRRLSDLAGMLPTAKLLMGLSMRLPVLIPPMLRLWMARMRRHPELYLESVLPHLSPKDAEVLLTTHMQAHYRQSFVEAISQGDEGLFKELKIMASDWGYLLPLSHPVTLWHGEDDNHMPIHHSERLLTLLPNSRLERVPDSGHYLLYHCWRNILAALVAEIASLQKEQ